MTLAVPCVAAAGSEADVRRGPNVTVQDNCGLWHPQALSKRQLLTCPGTAGTEPISASIGTGFSRTALLPELVPDASATGRFGKRGLSGIVTSAEYEMPRLKLGPLNFEQLPVLGRTATQFPFQPIPSS